MDIEEIKTFLKIDDDEDITLFYTAAKEYIESTIGECDESKARVKLLILNMVATLHENRLFTVDKANEKVQYTLRSIINQLQLEKEMESDFDGS